MRKALIDKCKELAKIFPDVEGALRQDNIVDDPDSPEICMCFLGLVCEVAIKETGVVQWERGDPDDVYMLNRYGVEGQFEIPPKCVLDWAGITEDQARLLAIINDNADRDEVFEFLKNAETWSELHPKFIISEATVREFSTTQ